MFSTISGQSTAKPGMYVKERSLSFPNKITRYMDYENKLMTDEYHVASKKADIRRMR